MSFHRYRSTWRSLTFNGLYDDTGIVDDPTGAHFNNSFRRSDFRLEVLDLNRVESIDYREMRQWYEGAEPNEAYESIMIAEGHGIILGNNHGDLEDREALIKAQMSIADCRIAALALDPPNVLPFYCKRDTGSDGNPISLLFYARPTSGRPVVISKMKEGLARRFSFSLTSFDPKLYSQTLQSVSCSTSGTTTLTNGGNLYTQPQIVVVTSGTATIHLTISGPAANSIVFTGVPLGTWTIDVRRGLIYDGSGNNGMQYRTSGFLSALFLAAGANTFDMTGSSAITSVTAKFRDAWT